MSDALQELLARAQTHVGSSLRGKYLLERVLGVGAMAAVFAGTHRNGTRVAIKVLHKEVARVAEIKTRFLREGYIANRIEHPGVVRIIDDDEDDQGTAFIVMELLSGQTVEREWADAGRVLPLARVAVITDALLDILDAAHAAGVIHRDIKPDNVFMTHTGELKVFDFGIARLIESSSKTKSGQMMGTPEFVSPEQAGGNVRDIDARSDVFSVGALMFTLLSGQHPHVARTSMEYMVRAATTPARSVFDVMPNINGAIANVIDVALSFDKKARWTSAKQMQTALHNATGGMLAPKPPTAPRASVPEVEAPRVSGTQTVRLGGFDPPADNEPIPLRKKD